MFSIVNKFKLFQVAPHFCLCMFVSDSAPINVESDKKKWKTWEGPRYFFCYSFFFFLCLQTKFFPFLCLYGCAEKFFWAARAFQRTFDRYQGLESRTEPREKRTMFSNLKRFTIDEPLVSRPWAVDESLKICWVCVEFKIRKVCQFSFDDKSQTKLERWATYLKNLHFIITKSVGKFW